MAVTIKCADCGHTAQSEDGASKTCPECEGTMTAPAKKKYQAKSTSLEDEERAKKKSKARDEDEPKAKKALSLDDEDEEDEKPKAKKPKPRGKGDGPARDGAAAEALGIDPGFDNAEFMEQVAAELDRDEVLHWAGRMRPENVAKSGPLLKIAGFAFAGMGVLCCLLVLAIAPGVLKAAAVFPLLFVALGLAVALVLPGVVEKQATRGWYAVTDQRAIIYRPSLFGSGGKAENYLPKDLRKMQIAQSRTEPGTGDVVFKTVKGASRSGNTTTFETVNIGFIGIDNVGEVETLIHKVLLGADD